jgi:hypothetical protein
MIRRSKMLAILAVLAAVGADPAATETPNLHRAPAHCADVQRRVAERQVEQFRQLGRLPRARGEYAVQRRVDGCTVPAPVGYRQDYLLPGAADAPEFRRGDGRSNRR